MEFLCFRFVIVCLSIHDTWNWCLYFFPQAHKAHNVDLRHAGLHSHHVGRSAGHCLPFHRCWEHQNCSIAAIQAKRGKRGPDWALQVQPLKGQKLESSSSIGFEKWCCCQVSRPAWLYTHQCSDCRVQGSLYPLWSWCWRRYQYPWVAYRDEKFGPNSKGKRGWRICSHQRIPMAMVSSTSQSFWPLWARRGLKLTLKKKSKSHLLISTWMGMD